MPSKPLWIVGAGGFAREVAWLASHAVDLADGQPWELKGFVVADGGPEATVVAGIPIVTVSQLAVLSSEEVWCVAAIGDPRVRARAVAGLACVSGCHWARLVHPRASVGPRVAIGPGTIVAAGAVLTCDIVVASHVILNLNVTVGHDSSLGPFVTVSPGASISGRTDVGPSAYVGTKAAILEGHRIGEGSVVGAGAVVTRDVPAGLVVVGVPARPLVRSSPRG